MFITGDNTERATTTATPPRALAPGGNASLHADLSSLSAAGRHFSSALSTDSNRHGGRLENVV